MKAGKGGVKTKPPVDGSTIKPDLVRIQKKLREQLKADRIQHLICGATIIYSVTGFILMSKNGSFFWNRPGRFHHILMEASASSVTFPLPIAYTERGKGQIHALVRGLEDFYRRGNTLTHVLLDDNRLPHSIVAPAMVFDDGFEAYLVHGLPVPPRWINDKTHFAPEEALLERNAELRRAAFEILGWDTILKKLNAKIIDENPNPQIGTLVEVDHPAFGGRARFIRVICGTGRTFAIPVPLERQTALEANAGSYRIPPELLLKLEVRT